MTANPTVVGILAVATPFLLLAPFVVATVLRRVRARRRMNLLFARPCGDHDVTPGSAPVRPPAGSGVTIQFNPRTQHLVSAPATRAVEPGVPAPTSLRRPGGAGTNFVAWLDRHLVRLCLTLLGGALACVAAGFVVVGS